MKLSIPVALALAALVAASPVAVVNNEIAAPSALGKRCFLWLLFKHKPKPCPPARKPVPPKPKPTPCPPAPCPPPSPTPCPETKRSDEQEENLAQLFNFIDAANEDDVKQFVHFYKNADKAEVEAWWSGQTVSSEFAPSFPASRVEEIAQSDTEPASLSGPEPTDSETKREDQDDNLAQLFNFIDAANEEDVNEFVHFYKNADKADVEAWWSGETVNSEFAPSFPASRVHEIAQSDIDQAST